MVLNCPTWRLRKNQRPPGRSDWLTWLLIGGRGSGKTLAGSTWVHYLATGMRPAASVPTEPIALIGETIHEVREVMIDGPSGIRQVAAFERPVYEASRRRLVWPNGCVARAFSAHDPESLRGPQFSVAWADELGKYPNAQQVWDMLQFGLRLGSWPRQMVTTTPRPTKLLRSIMDDPHTCVSHMPTSENAANLASPFLAAMNKQYGGTRLGRQELEGEYLEEREGALWSSKLLDQSRSKNAPTLKRIVVAVDPPVTSKSTSDACGIIAAGLADDGKILVLGDHSLKSVSPSRWARKVCEAYHHHGADTVIAETNQGGELVPTMIRNIDPSVHVTSVHARKSKYMRAEPVSLLYEQGRVSHLGTHAELEDEMCNFDPSGLASGHSPDRVDALVWAISALVGDGSIKPKIRPI